MMPGVQLEEIWNAFTAGYTKKSLQQMLMFRLNKDLDDLVGDGSMRDMVFDLLTLAEREGWTTDLVREGYLYNPRNNDLLKVYEKYHLAPAVSVQSGDDAALREAQLQQLQPLSGGFERTIKSRLPGFDFAVFREKMALVEGRVCKVEIDGNAAGTGFLVGPDAVLTNYHVLAEALQGKSPAEQVTCRFDYKVLSNGSRLEGTAVKLHATDWNLDFSPPSPAESTRTPSVPLPTPDELDYALVRLDRRLGDEPSSPLGGEGGPKRGWLALPSVAPVFLKNNPLMIAQHPDGKPLKLVVDTESVIGVNANRTRVQYATNTEAGSSGSPVFDLGWNLVALHHLGDPAYDHPPSYNQGVIIDLIRKRIENRGKGEALGA
jgi:hypothetical protein